MRESERKAPFVAPSAWQDVSTGTCPGYLITLPGVLDVARLHPWWDRGQLMERLQEQPSALLCDGIDELQASMNACEAHGWERSSAK